MGLQVTLAGQDISTFIDEFSIDIESNLGQGPGVPQGSSGRATTCQLLAWLGPAATAVGAAAVLPPASYQSLVEGASPLAYYQLEDPAGSLTIADSSGLSGAGTVASGTPQLGVAGGPLTGSTCAITANGYWNIPTAALPTGNAPITFEAWAQYTANAALQGLLSVGPNTVNTGLTLGVSSTGLPQFRTPAGTAANGTTALTAGVWHHLVGVYDGINLLVYLDGVLAGQSAYTTLNLTPSGGAEVGSLVGNNTKKWLGELGQVAIYAGALTPAQVLAHYNARTGITSTPQLVRQGELLIQDATGTRIFGGYVSDLQDKTTYTRVKTQIIASDYWQDLARTGVNNIYTSEHDTNIIQDLMATYAPGIDMSLFNPTPNYLFTKIYLKAKTLQQALQMIADTTGFNIWIDPYKRLHYESPSSGTTAPFAVSDSPDFITSYPLALNTYERDDTAIINRVFFYGGKTPSDNYTQDISPQANGNNTTFVLAYYPRPTTDGKIHLTVNGVEQVIGAALGTGPSNILKSLGGTADVLLNSSAQAFLFDIAPATGATILASYRYETPMVVQVTSTTSFTYFGRWFDGFISDTTVLDKQTAIQRSRILLNEQSFGLEHVNLSTWRSGLAAGQLLRIDHGVKGLHSSYIVQTVKVVPLGNGQFQWDVDLGGWNWTLIDVLIQAGRNGMIIDQNDNESDDIVQAQDGLFGLNIHITVSQTSQSSGGYFARATPVGDGHDAYPGLFTITS